VKVAVLGIDGLYPAFFQDFAPDLPVFSELKRKGSLNVLYSTVPPFTPQAWTTMLTGANPGTHGIAGFVLKLNGERKPVDRTDIQVPSLIEHFADQGVRVGVLNVPLSYPAPPGATFAVSGMLTPGVNAPGFTQPPDLAAKLLSAVPAYVIDVAVQKHHLEDRTVWARLEAMAEARLQAARFLLRSFQVDLFFVVFVVLDRFCHLAFRYFCGKDPLAGSPRAERLRRLFSGIMRGIDAFAGELCEKFDSVLVVSDHGFRPEIGKFYLPLFLEKNGLFKPIPSLKRKVADLAVAVLGRSLLRRLLPSGFLSRELARNAPRPGPGSRAWPSELAAQGVWCPDPAQQDRLRELLSELRHPRSGEPLLTGIWKRDELYRGPCVQRFPHLVLELLHGGIEVSPHAIGRRALHLTPSDWPGGHHDRHGVALVYSQDARVKPKHEAWDMVDVVPSLCSLMGIKAPPWAEGSSRIQTCG